MCRVLVQEEAEPSYRQTVQRPTRPRVDQAALPPDLDLRADGENPVEVLSVLRAKADAAEGRAAGRQGAAVDGRVAAEADPPGAVGIAGVVGGNDAAVEADVTLLLRSLVDNLVVAQLRR